MKDLLKYELQLKRISKKLAQLKALDKKFIVFGTQNHKYELLKPISSKNLEKLEKKYGVCLPDEYVAFITTIGDGGAGPYYGLYPIEMALIETDVEIDGEDEEYADSDITKPSYFESKETLKNYMEEYKNIEDIDSRYNQANRILNGTLEINSEGCTFRNNMILNGANSGKIFEVCWDVIEDGFYESTYNKLIGFLDWYEKWLDNGIEECKQRYVDGKVKPITFID